ncbi:MAG TPA: hypothetical protein VNA88_05975 [Candidatus Kapabacteria bacterium]|nr:hypothetical protein [Candidatus Kapabacteria bacterium]
MRSMLSRDPQKTKPQVYGCTVRPAASSFPRVVVVREDLIDAETLRQPFRCLAVDFVERVGFAFASIGFVVFPAFDPLAFGPVPAGFGFDRFDDNVAAFFDGFAPAAVDFAWAGFVFGPAALDFGPAGFDFTPAAFDPFLAAVGFAPAAFGFAPAAFDFAPAAFDVARTFDFTSAFVDFAPTGLDFDAVTRDFAFAFVVPRPDFATAGVSPFFAARRWAASFFLRASRFSSRRATTNALAAAFSSSVGPESSESRETVFLRLELRAGATATPLPASSAGPLRRRRTGASGISNSTRGRCRGGAMTIIWSPTLVSAVRPTRASTGLSARACRS